jgi:hypothetical protein
MSLPPELLSSGALLPRPHLRDNTRCNNRKFAISITVQGPTDSLAIVLIVRIQLDKFSVKRSLDDGHSPLYLTHFIRVI